MASQSEVVRMSDLSDTQWVEWYMKGDVDAPAKG